MDDQSLAEIYARAFPQSRNPWDSDSFAAFRRDSNIIFLTSTHGCLIASVVLDEAEILTIFVDPPFQHQGQAKALLEELISKLFERKIKKIFIEVAQSNENALRFYESFQFEHIASRKNYYELKNGGREDALILCRTLKSKNEE